MKRAATLIFLIFLLPGLFAAELTDQKKIIELQGYLDSFCTISVAAINAESGTATEGLPFDMMGASIKYNSANIVDGDLTNGRIIGNWTLATNSANKTLTVKATPFVHENMVTEIDYYISFRIDYIDDNGSSQTEYLTIDTSNIGATGETFEIDCTGTVVSEEKSILLMFKEYSDEEREAWPNGYYEANVSFILTGE